MYRRQKSSKLSLDDVDVDIDDIDDDEEDDNDRGGNVRPRPDRIVDEQELSDLAANEQDEQSYRESAMQDWLSTSSSVVPSTTAGGAAAATGPRTGPSKNKGKMKTRQKTDDKHSSLQQQQRQLQQQHEQNREVDHADPLQEHRDLLDTQWKRIRSLDRTSKQQHTIGGGSGAGGGAGTAGSGSRRGMLLSQTIHEESSETESL